MTGGENTTAVDEMTAVEGILEFFAVGTRGFAVMTDAPTGMRGADGLTFALGRRTGAKASAADQPIRKKPDDHEDNQDGKQGDRVWRLRRARRTIFNKQILRFYGGQIEIPAEGLAVTAVDSEVA